MVRYLFRNDRKEDDKGLLRKAFRERHLPAAYVWLLEPRNFRLKDLARVPQSRRRIFGFGSDTGFPCLSQARLSEQKKTVEIRFVALY